MIKEITMYSVCCDNCGKDSNEGAEYSCWNDSGYAWQCAEEDGWEEDFDQHYCPDCFSWSDDDELILKPENKE